ncbi:MAG: PqqD family protein [FCB group bacterium]|jgi:hypothetical protein|nr:PqqD family protein [FCB group bacterium]
MDVQQDDGILDRKITRMFAPFRRMPELDNNVMLLTSDGEKHMFNPSAGVLWEAIDDLRTGAEIIEAAKASLGIEEEDAEAFERTAVDFLLELRDRRLIAIENDDVWN